VAAGSTAGAGQWKKKSSKQRVVDPKVTPAQHTAAKSQAGSKLKWVPYRPARPRLVAASGDGSLRTAQRPPSPAFKDPFEDMKKQKSTEEILEEVLQREKRQPTADESLPPEPPAAIEEEETLAPPVQDVDQPPPTTGGYEAATGPTKQEEIDKCDAERRDLKQINELGTDITATRGDFPTECALANDPFMPRAWAPTTFTWKASGLCHKPLYFEDVALERYGHSWGPYLQPILSGAHFFITFPILPYKMGLYPPCECMYTLGYYRPGNCAPYMLDPLPISVRAGLAEAGAVLGAAYIIP